MNRFSRGFLALVIVFCCIAAFAQQFDPALYQDMGWRLIGPFRGGRTVGLAGIPNQPNVFYIGVNDGGVWKTTDFGQTWNPIFDNQPTQSIGALAVAPSNPNIIYVGSGEGLRRPDLSVGDGIYKSTDGGQSWQHLGLRDGQQIASIAIDPRNPDRVFVAVLGHPYGPNSERGLFRSLDGGKSWQKVLYKDEDTGAVQVLFDPGDPQVIYADMWASRRPPWTTGSGLLIPGKSGLYKSSDGGNTWSQLTNGFPTGEQGLSRIGIGIAPSASKRIYALVDAKKETGVYRSDDAGATWKRTNSEDRVTGRGDDFACVAVDPKNPDVLYAVNTSTYKSTDGGVTFTPFKGAPGGDDYHWVWINPENPQIIALTSDQGATISVNGGATWSSWYNQPTAQFYHVITDNRFPYWVYGGQQESGSAGIASRSDFGEITFRDWHPVGTEEYGYVAPDPLNPNFIYGGKATRFDLTTKQTRDVSPVVLRTGKYRFNRTAPLIFSAADPHALYLGSNVLFKTTNGGDSWEIVSPDLTREDPGVPPSLGADFMASDPSKTKHRGVIYSVAPSPKDANLVWAGTDDGLVHVTRDGGKNWQNVTPPELTPWSKVAQIDASHFDTAAAYVAVNRFRLDDLHAYIYRTHDGGKSWQKITNGIPDSAAVNTVREDPTRKGLLFAGTEDAVYVSFNDGDSWQSLQLNLPTTSVRDLVIHGDDAIVGTHGRSFWILDDITPLRQLSEQVAGADVHLFEPQLTYRLRSRNYPDTPLPPETPAGKNPPDGAVIDYFLRTAPSGPVTIEITDSAGKQVRRYSSDDKPTAISKDINVPTYWVQPSQIPSVQTGMHRFVWDLHYPPPDVLERDYPISALPRDTPLYPLGPIALPGAYTVKLTANGQTQSQPLTIKMDPRVSASATDLQEQSKFELEIAAALHRDFVAIQEVRALRKQLKALRPPAANAALVNAIAALEKNAGELEGTTGGYGTTFLSSPAGKSLSRLNAGLGSLLTVADSADAAPTTQQQTTLKDLEMALSEQVARWEEMKNKDVGSLNQTLKYSNLPEITLQPK